MPAGTAAKNSRKKANTPKPDESLTEAELERRAKFREYGRRGGLARRAKSKDYLKDEGKAHEIIKDKWTELADYSADEALAAARSDKTDPKALVGKFTAAAIAYDKRWSKQVTDSQDIDIPASLALQISSKLSKPLTNNESSNMVQSKPCTESEEQAEPVDPLLLSPGL